MPSSPWTTALSRTCPTRKSSAWSVDPLTPRLPLAFAARRRTWGPPVKTMLSLYSEARRGRCFSTPSAAGSVAFKAHTGPTWSCDDAEGIDQHVCKHVYFPTMYTRLIEGLQRSCYRLSAHSNDTHSPLCFGSDLRAATPYGQSAVVS